MNNSIAILPNIPLSGREWEYPIVKTPKVQDINNLRNRIAFKIIEKTQGQIQDISSGMSTIYDEIFIDLIAGKIIKSSCSKVTNVFFSSASNHGKVLNVTMESFDKEQHRKISGIYLDLLNEYPLGYFDIRINY